ncbi:MAG: acetylxylan esterase [Candidatus Hydrogenedentes bacterium]|nr:acetylxylan esterase [Candidatus Hydrogenedentota bacterium]
MTIITTALMVAASLLGQAPDLSTEATLTRAALPDGKVLEEVQRYLQPKVPPLVVPETREAWETQATALRQRYLDETVLKGVPTSWTEGDVQIRWVETIETGKGYRIRKLLYEGLPGMWVPALLYEPDGDATDLPCVLNVNGHYDEGKSRPEEQIRCINLAKRGVLNLHPEWIGMGELGGVDNAHNRSAYLDAVGIRGVSVFYLTLSRALDVLQAHERADGSRIGMSGLSGGGWQTAMFSALNERVSVIVPVAGHGAMGVRIENGSDIGDLEQVPGDMLTVADYTHLTALFAPRPTLLIYNAQDNCCFQAARTLHAIYDPVVPVYALYNASTDFEFHINEDPGTHNYDLDNRLQFYRFINQHLAPETVWSPDELPTEGELLTREELTVGIPEDNKTIVSLALEAAQAISRGPTPSADSDGFSKWQREHRALLKKTLRYTPVSLRTVATDLETDGSTLVTTYRFKNADWTIPAAAITPPGADRSELRLLLHDGGLGGVSETFTALAEAGMQVAALAPLFQEGNRPAGSNSWQYSMILNATGERSLALQAAQTAAICDWYRTAKGVDKIIIQSTGVESGLIALVTASLHPGLVDEVALNDMPGSLVDLFEARKKYNASPSLYPFGFLQHFDVDVLKALAGL